MTPERRAELRKLREAGTPGEWEYVSTPEWTDVSVRYVDGSRSYGELTSDDYDLVPAAVNALAPLLDALDEAQKRLAELEGALESLRPQVAILRRLANALHGGDAVTSALSAAARTASHAIFKALKGGK